MSETQDLAELLQQALGEIDEAGGREKHLLRQTIGKPAFDKMMSKQRTADLIDRWEKASGKAKALATRALALAIAKTADRGDLVDRIHNELNDAVDITPTESRWSPESNKRSPTRTQVKKHAAAQHQRSQGQRVGYEKSKRVSADMLARLAANGDMSEYYKARQNSRH